MNARERFLETALFGKPDKVPLAIGGVRPATRRSWIRQGLPKNQHVSEYLNFKACTLRSVNITSYPWEGFEWKLDLGVTQMGFQSDWKDGWSGFATRVFIEFPVKNRKDFLEMKKRYNPKDPERYPKNWSKIAKANRKRDYPLSVNIRGPFWWTRDMIGLNRIAIGIYKEPEFIREIMDFCAEFHVEALHRALEDVDVDYVIVSEDMAYKKGPMIGPETVKKIMGSAYREIVKFFRGHGVKVIGVDSDGNVEPLIPVWLELGINCITP